jgi:hypothetical protein
VVRIERRGGRWPLLYNDVMTDGGRRYRAGDRIDDLCRPCKSVRAHAVIVATPDGTPLRVLCDHCGSQHNYRGGATRRSATPRPATATPPARSTLPMSEPSSSAPGDLEQLLRRVLREEAGLTPVVPSDKWRGGHLVLRPGREGLQEKSWPIDGFFHKVVMLRNRLRVMEQQINAADLPEDVKIKLQSHITACYGSLTSFNVLFAEEDDRFHGSGGKT